MADSAEILAALVAERGPLDVASMAIARSLAVLLSQELPDGRAISAISTLSEMLPPRSQAGDASYDLSRLSDVEFRFFAYLTAKAKGERPLRPPRTLSTREGTDPPAAACRLGTARAFGRLCDAVADGDGVLTITDRNNIRAWIGFVIAPLTSIEELFSIEIRAAAEALAAKRAPAPAPTPPAPEKLLAGAPAGNAGPTPPPAPAGPSPDNVVALRRDIHGGEHSLARSDGPLLGGVSNQRKSFERFDNNGPLP